MRRFFENCEIFWIALLGIASPTWAQSAVELENGVEVSDLAAAVGDELYFVLAVPAGATDLFFTTTSGEGDADLFVSFGTQPTFGSAECTGFNSTSDEYCRMEPVQEGNYFVTVRGFTAFSGVGLLGCFTPPGGSPKPPAEPRWRETGSLGEARSDPTATLLPTGEILVVGTASAELYDPAAGRWRTAEPPSVSRAEHTATLLPTGEVLVVGPSDAELYDPATGTWRPAAAPAAQRSGWTATLLHSGRVLVIGGVSSELYVPADDRWEAPVLLARRRSAHTATLLRSGEVLVVGGLADGVPIAAAELYDPLVESWESAGSTTARWDHTATLLPSGDVVVAGGRRADGSPLSGAERYGALDGTWTRTGSLTLARYAHAAALMPSGRILLIGGFRFPSARADSELYDPETGVWEEIEPLLTPRGGHTATLLPTGGVLVAGGADGGALSSAELYERPSRSWQRTGSLTVASDGHTATLLSSGKVLVAGGDRVSRAELYDPAAGTWEGVGALAVPRFDHTATLLPTGEVFAAGGTDGIFTTHSSTEIYDPLTRQWRGAPAMSVERAGHTATLLPTEGVLVVGGGSSPRAEIYDFRTSSWSETAPLLTSRHAGHTATLLESGQVLVVAGSNGNALSSAELYDPRLDTWESTGSLTTPRSGHTATLLPSGQVLVAGGFNESFGYLSNAELYDPAVGEWRATGSLTLRRGDHTASLLPSGQVLVAGGQDQKLNFVLSHASAELYDPATGTWEAIDPLLTERLGHTATLLPSGRVLIAAGRRVSTSSFSDAELFDPAADRGPRRPRILSTSSGLEFGQPFQVSGEFFRGDSEASDGTAQSSAVNYPLVRLYSLESGQVSWLLPDARASFADEPMTLTIGELPASLNPGGHLLTVVTAGASSDGALVDVRCSVAVTRQPADQTADLGASARFEVNAQGGRFFQWRRDGIDISGATGPAYVTPPVLAADAGTTYSVVVSSGCASQVSDEATLHVADAVAPTAAVVTPSGGEFWILADPDPESPASTEVVAWEMSDNVRVCRLDAMLLFSDDGGTTYQPAPPGGGLPASIGPGGACRHEDRVETTSLVYTVPTEPPSGSEGSLYKVRIDVTDQAGNVTTATSTGPFFIVKPNPDNVRTLILTHSERLAALGPTAMLETSLRDLAHHPRVQGLVVDLAGVSSLSALYAAWDAERGNPDRANQVLFGCHPPLPAGGACAVERDGVHDLLLDLLRAYGGVESVVLVGDDPVIPMARLQDRTVLFPESRYPVPANGDLTPGGTSVGEALAANKYLSDDPLAVLDPVRFDDLNASLFLPDLAIGRLVETPPEIVTTIATYISRDGVLDLAELDPATGHKVQVTGYDFLSDVAARIRDRWRNAYAAASPPGSVAPVDAALIGQGWNDADLVEHFCGNGGAPYGLLSLNGHAVHYAEGVPGSDPLDITGVESADLAAAAACGAGELDLAGSVLYAVGCHGGLPVSGSDPLDADHSLDLPQTFLGRGAVAYVANSGYGWGLKHGIGYSERLVEIFSEEMSLGRVAVGDAVRAAKQRYFLEAPRFDPYDEKTLMQWTVFGLPMYVVDPGLPVASRRASSPWLAADGRAERSAVERLGGILVERRRSDPEAKAGLPAFLTRLQLHFDLTAPGLYTKYDASGDVLSDVPGCPAPAPGRPAGCYYTLNGLVERSTGLSDLPIQPYFIYDSRLAGTSQHGVLWMGGDYDEESGWTPVIAELVSNGGDSTYQDTAPRFRYSRPHDQRDDPGRDPPACRPSDRELSTMVVTTGEVLKPEASDPTYSIERLYRELDLEIFYFNDTVDSLHNCDRAGPRILPGPFAGDYHRRNGTAVEWAVEADDEAGIWRVIVVYNDDSVDANGRGRWIPLELAFDGDTWRGSVNAAGASRLTYMVQAVDGRGNVSWLEFESAELPPSGVPLGEPLAVDVEIGPGVADLALALSDTPDPVEASGLLAYTLTLTNHGPDPATSIVVTDTLPSGVGFVVAAGDGWSCGASTGEVICRRERLAEASTAPPITLLVSAPELAGTLVNMASVTALESDPEAANDSASEPTQVLSSPCTGADSDGDGVADVCDVCDGFDDTADGDGDTVPDGCDQCLGDDVTGDPDADGLCTEIDICLGDNASGDIDVDSVCADLDCDDSDPEVGTVNLCGTCGEAECVVFIDGFESGSFSAWGPSSGSTF